MLRGLLTAAALFLAAPNLAAAEPDYARDVKPLREVLRLPRGGPAEGRARLDAGQLVLKGDKRGPVVVPGKPDESPLIEVITPTAATPRGCRRRARASRSPRRTSRCSASGSRPGRRRPTNRSPKTRRTTGPISRPAARRSQRREPRGGTRSTRSSPPSARSTASPPTPEADKPTLLRRVYLDLIGLPPTPAELHAFLAGRRRRTPTRRWSIELLALAACTASAGAGTGWTSGATATRSGYGEEFRYSQRHVWRWRDWIVESLNADKGYDRMIVEMLAGDEIAPADPRHAPRHRLPRAQLVQVQPQRLDPGHGRVHGGRASSASRSRCAGCHDHKYDPISQAGLLPLPRVLRAARRPHRPRARPAGHEQGRRRPRLRQDAGRPDVPVRPRRRADAGQVAGADAGRAGVFGTDPAVTAITFTPEGLRRARCPAARPRPAGSRRPISTPPRPPRSGRPRPLPPRSDGSGHRGGRGAEGTRIEAVPARHVRQEGQRPLEGAERAVGVGDGQARLQGAVHVRHRDREEGPPGGPDGPHPSTRRPAADIGGIGFSYDVDGKDFQAVYINAGSSSAVRPFHRVNGQDTYPPEGVVPFPVKLNDEVTLDFAVRGNLLNVWANGKLTSVYRLPVARKAGGFTIWAHDATAEFCEVTLAELPDSVPLAEKRGRTAPSPVGGPVVLTKADAEKLVSQAEAAAVAGERPSKPPAPRSPRSRPALAADAAQFAEPRRSEGEVARARRRQGRAAGRGARGRRGGAERRCRQVAAAKAKPTADAAAAKDDPTYTPLVKVDAASSTGRRLALAKWIADAGEPADRPRRGRTTSGCGTSAPRWCRRSPTSASTARRRRTRSCSTGWPSSSSSRSGR